MHEDFGNGKWNPCDANSETAKKMCQTGKVWHIEKKLEKQRGVQKHQVIE